MYVEHSKAEMLFAQERISTAIIASHTKNTSQSVASFSLPFFSVKASQKQLLSTGRLEKKPPLHTMQYWQL